MGSICCYQERGLALSDINTTSMVQANRRVSDKVQAIAAMMPTLTERVRRRQE